MTVLLLLFALLTPADVANKSLPELRLMRGEVFGRHGRIFGADHDIDRWLRAQSWYKPDRDYRNDQLTDEQINPHTIAFDVAVHHAQHIPGTVGRYGSHSIRARRADAARISHKARGSNGCSSSQWLRARVTSLVAGIVPSWHRLRGRDKQEQRTDPA